MKRHEVYYDDLSDSLASYEADKGVLGSIEKPQSRDVFIWQVVDSIRRVEYFEVLKKRGFSEKVCRPELKCFDPIKAAIKEIEAGNIEEACWLIFLATHFGKHKRDGWKLASQIYGACGQRIYWTWGRVANNPKAFLDWLSLECPIFFGEGVAGKFGNHRKYESINPESKSFTGYVFQSYIWRILSEGGHEVFVNNAVNESNGDAHKAFEWLYLKIKGVYRFGRMAAFDYVSMLAKVGVVEACPGSAYLSGASGPVTGAKLFFYNDEHASVPVSQLENDIDVLSHYLKLGVMNKQVLEDALCNWQKSPAEYIYFRG